MGCQRPTSPGIERKERIEGILGLALTIFFVLLCIAGLIPIVALIFNIPFPK